MLLDLQKLPFHTVQPLIFPILSFCQTVKNKQQTLWVFILKHFSPSLPRTAMDIQHNHNSSPHLRKAPNLHSKVHLKALFLHSPMQLPVVTQKILSPKTHATSYSQLSGPAAGERARPQGGPQLKLLSQQHTGRCLLETKGFHPHYLPSSEKGLS